MLCLERRVPVAVVVVKRQDSLELQAMVAGVLSLFVTPIRFLLQHQQPEARPQLLAVVIVTTHGAVTAPLHSEVEDGSFCKT